MARNPNMDFEDDVIDRLARMEELLHSHTGQGVDHETRLRTMEKRQWLLAGVAAGLAPLLSKLGLHIPSL